MTIAIYIFIIIILFLLGGLLTFLNSRSKVKEPKDGWKKFED